MAQHLTKRHRLCCHEQDWRMARIRRFQAGPALGVSALLERATTIAYSLYTGGSGNPSPIF